MNAKTLVELALKVWGIILLVGALVSLPVALLMVNVPAGDDSQAAWVRATQRGSVLHLVIQVAAGVAVVVWADGITNLIESDTAPLHIDASARDLQVLGFALVGVFVLLHGLENIAATAYVWFSKPGWPHLDPSRLAVVSLVASERCHRESPRAGHRWAAAHLRPQDHRDRVVAAEGSIHE